MVNSLEENASLNILLVEDNLINQELVSQILKRKKHNVSIAENGIEALKLYDNESFDIILMDIHMPDMDGFEATQKILEKEERTGRPHTPIIAITAHALKGDREHCLEMGMDSYISKPIKPEILFSKIDDVIKMKKGEIASFTDSHEDVYGSISLPEDDVFNKKKFLENLSDDKSIVLDIINNFLDNYTNMLENINKAIVNKDISALEFSAHTFKSCVVNLFASDTIKAAYELEKMGHKADLTEAVSAYKHLQNTVKRLVPRLISLLEEKRETNENTT